MTIRIGQFTPRLRVLARSRRVLFSSLAGLAISLGLGVLARSAAPSLIPAASRRAAPALTLTDIAGSKINLAQYRGKVVLLDFWAVDCGGCVIEIPWYVEFDKKYRNQGLQVLGIDMYDEAPAYIRPFMQKTHMEYPVAVGNDDIRKQFEADSLPKTLLIDWQGRVAFAHVGIVDKATFEQAIEELLKQDR